MDIRNIAVIAHVDHGKTTLIDALLKQTHVFRDNQAEMSQTTILDSNDLERERGITILAKNCAIHYKDTKINIIDTPGHADFSGEVERTLSMADGALLIVDAQEGPMPQTRFVLKKAMELNLKIIVVINKIDKQFARVPQVITKTENLFLDLAANDEQLHFPILYAVGRNGSVFTTLPDDPQTAGNTIPLLDTILEHIPAPKIDASAPFLMLVSSLDFNPHLGRLLIGKIRQGSLEVGQKVNVTNSKASGNVAHLFEADGLGRKEITNAPAGDIVYITGIDASIGDTLADPSVTTIIPSQAIGLPTLHLTMGPNTSPFSGREGKFTTSRQIEERLDKELEKNLSLRVEKQDSGKFRVSGRGELHLAVLLETMRREGYEMEVGKPQVITKKEEGGITEPVEEVSIIVPSEYVGAITQEIGQRQGQLLNMEPLSELETEFTYKLPTRSIIGLRSILLTLTKGTVIFSSQLIGYQPLGAQLPKLRPGVLVASATGQALTYGLQAAQGRGSTFVGPGTDVYEGMIIGLNTKDDDIEINVIKGKQLTNTRAASADDIIKIAPPIIFSLEQSLDFLEPDELLEITPLNLRLRKRFLSEIDRRRQSRNFRHEIGEI